MDPLGLSSAPAGVAGGAAAARPLPPVDAAVIPIDVDSAMDLPAAVSLRDVLTLKGTWTWLPELTDFAVRIAEYLDPDDLGRLMRVSRAWRDAGTAMATNMHKVWYKHIRSMPELPDPSTMRCIERLDLTGYDRVELLTPGRVTPGRATPTRSSARRSTSSSFGSPASFGSSTSLTSTPLHASADAATPAAEAGADAPSLHGVGFAVPSVRRATPTSIAAAASGALPPPTTRRQRAADLSAAIVSMTAGAAAAHGAASDTSASPAVASGSSVSAEAPGGGACIAWPVPSLRSTSADGQVVFALAAPSPITPAMPVAIAIVPDGVPVISAPPLARPPRPVAVALRGASGGAGNSIGATAAAPIGEAAFTPSELPAAEVAPAAAAVGRSRSAGAAADGLAVDDDAATPPVSADGPAAHPPASSLVRSHSAGAASGGSGAHLHAVPPVSLGCSSPPRAVSAGSGAAPGLGGDTERSTWLDRFLMDKTACERLKAVKLGANMPVPLMTRLLTNCINLEAVSFAGIESIKDEVRAQQLRLLLPG